MAGKGPDVGHSLPRGWSSALQGEEWGNPSILRGLLSGLAQISPFCPCMAIPVQDLVAPAVGLEAVSPQANQASEKNQWQ